MTRQPRHLATLTSEQLRIIAESTLGHYNNRAPWYWQGTRDHDVSQNISALVRHLPGDAPQRILDLGCGPGRDLVTFRDMGHEPVGLEGAEEFVHMARQHSGCEVLHQDFLELDLLTERFHGVFANASLFHVPSQELSRVLGTLWQSLVPGGVLFSSNPRGQNREGWFDDRYGCYLDLTEWRLFLASAGFAELEHYYRPPGKPRDQQPWLASVWRKPV